MFVNFTISLELQNHGVYILRDIFSQCYTLWAYVEVIALLLFWLGGKKRKPRGGNVNVELNCKRFLQKNRCVCYKTMCFGIAHFIVVRSLEISGNKYCNIKGVASLIYFMINDNILGKIEHIWKKFRRSGKEFIGYNE